LSDDQVNDAGRSQEGTEAGNRPDVGAAAPAPHAPAASANIGDRDSPQRDHEGAESGQIAEIDAVEEILTGEIDNPEIRDLVQTTYSKWHGPVPPPGALAAFERVLPGAADRVLSIAERSIAIRETREQTIRAAIDGQVDVETILAKADRDVLKRGMDRATLISIVVAGLAFAGMFLTPWAAVGFAVPLSQVASSLIRTVSDSWRARHEPEQSGE
jgi:hypothetical protein